MVARRWKARATGEGAKAYVAFFQGTLVPELKRIDGHRGALVFTRADGGGASSSVEIAVITFWDSMAAVARFAGATLDRAVLEPEARAALLSWDDGVTHDEVAVDTFRDAPVG